MEKKLYKSADDKVLAGVCGGIGEYFGVDPVIVRLLVVVFTLMGGAGLIAYIIAAIIIPEKNNLRHSGDTYTFENKESKPAEQDAVVRKSGGGSALALGIILIVLGGFVLLRGFLPWIPNELILSAILIGSGIYFVIKKTKA